jgi:cytochrome P450
MLREQQPVCRFRYPDGQVGWLVTSHALAKAVLTDLRFGMNWRCAPNGDPEVWALIFETFAKSGICAANFAEMDPPEHTRYRRLLAAPFSLRRIEVYRPRVEAVVDSVLDAIERSGPPADLVSAFATPIAGATQCLTLGAAEDDTYRFLRFNGVTFSPTSTLDEVRAAFDEFWGYLVPLIERKRREPADDVMSFVIGQNELSDEEIVSIIALLFIGGHGTTASQLALGAFALLTHPEQLAALRGDLDSIDAAVEELLRYVTVFQAGSHTRRALEDAQLDGALIRAGERVTVHLAAANRDPHEFEHPDALDLKRSHGRQLAFGAGMHMCIGHHLARMEVQIGLRKLLERFPTLRLAVPAEEVPYFSGDYYHYGLHELPVAW